MKVFVTCVLLLAAAVSCGFAAWGKSAGGVNLFYLGIALLIGALLVERLP